MTRTVNTVLDNTPINLPRGTTFQRNETNKSLLHAAWREAGANPEYPMDTRAVFALLRIMGFDANRQRLDYCIAREYLVPPQKERGQFAWRERDIVCFADCLEQLRAWVPLHQSHVHKLSADELAKAHQAAAAKSAAVTAFREMPVNEIINLLVHCEQTETRELLAMVLKEHIGLLHVRGNEQVPTHDPRETN